MGCVAARRRRRERPPRHGPDVGRLGGWRTAGVTLTSARAARTAGPARDRRVTGAAQVTWGRRCGVAAAAPHCPSPRPCALWLSAAARARCYPPTLRSSPHPPLYSRAPERTPPPPPPRRCAPCLRCRPRPRRRPRPSTVEAHPRRYVHVCGRIRPPRRRHSLRPRLSRKPSPWPLSRGSMHAPLSCQKHLRVRKHTAQSTWPGTATIVQFVYAGSPASSRSFTQRTLPRPRRIPSPSLLRGTARHLNCHRFARASLHLSSPQRSLPVPPSTACPEGRTRAPT